MQAIALGKNLLWSSTRIYFETFNLRWLYTLCVESTPENVVSYLESYSANLFKWFSNNDIKAHNPEKCHLLMNIKAIEMRKHIISNSYCEKLLGVKINSQLKFNNHLKAVTKKASQKVDLLAKITRYMFILKGKLLVNAFFKVQLNCCQIVWMCHSLLMNNKINGLHERYLRIIYNNTSSLVDLLAKGESVTIHTRNV